MAKKKITSKSERYAEDVKVLDDILTRRNIDGTIGMIADMVAKKKRKTPIPHGLGRVEAILRRTAAEISWEMADLYG